MRRKKEPVIQSLEELISEYDRPTLLRALSVLEHDVSWKVFRAALMKEYLRNASYVLDKAAKDGTPVEAGYYAGVAQSLYNTANDLIETYKDVISNNVQATAEPRPEE